MLQSAMLEIRVFPWRPRRRVMDPDDFRDRVAAADPFGSGDLSGLVLGLAVWLILIIAAPVAVIALAVLLLSVELPLVLLLAVLLGAARFLGVIPWTVLVLDAVSGVERRESYRNGLRAVRRVRTLNADRRVLVRWAWA